MSFDPTNAAQVLLLQQTLAGDATLNQYHEKDSGAPAKLLNDRNGPHSGAVAREALTGAALILALDPDEYVKLDAVEIARLQFLMDFGTIGTGTLDLAQAEVQALFVKLMSVSMPNTAANLAALATRQGSWAEVLFGTGTQLTPQDIAQAWRLK